MNELAINKKVFFLHEKEIWIGKIQNLKQDIAIVMSYKEEKEYLEISTERLFTDFVEICNLFQKEYPNEEIDIEQLMDKSRYLDLFP